MSDNVIPLTTDAARPNPVTDEVATARKDIDLFVGWLNRLENPDPVLRSESAGKGLKLYDEIARDAHAGSVLQTRYLSVIGPEWEIIPADAARKTGRPRGITQEQKIADFIKDNLLNTNFDQFRQELLQGILYGYMVGEIMWSARNGDVVIDHLLAKHPRRFIFTPERDLRLLTLSNMIDGEPVPDRKFVRFTFGSSDNPYGNGLGQSLWWPVWFKKNGIKFWMIFSEKFGSPTPVGKYPAGSTPEQKNTLLSAIESIQQETGITIPEGMAIDLLEAQRAGTVNTYETLCNYMDKQISKRVLGQTASTEGTPGKLGNDQTQEEVRQDIIKADADLLCECLNNTLIKWLVDYNFGPQAVYPKLWIRVEAEEDLKPLAERDKIILVDMGMGKRVPESYISDTYGIPLAEEGEAVIGTPPPSSLAPANAPNSGPKVPNSFAEGNNFTPSQQAVENLIAEITDRGEVVDPLLRPVLDFVARAENYQEILEKLYGLYPKLDSAKMEELISQALFASNLWGYLKSQERQY
jgi:phage gp29-like protein